MNDQITCGSRAETKSQASGPWQWPLKLGSGTRGRCRWARRVNQAVELLSHQSGRETKRNKSGGVMDDTILSFLKMLRAFERRAVLKGSRRRFHDGLACWDTLTHTNDKISAQLRGKRAPHRKGGAFQYQRMTAAECCRYIQWSLGPLNCIFKERNW